MSFNPNQPRDSDGKWSATGAAGQRLREMLKGHDVVLSSGDTGTGGSSTLSQNPDGSITVTNKSAMLRKKMDKLDMEEVLAGSEHRDNSLSHSQKHSSLEDAIKAVNRFQGNIRKRGPSMYAAKKGH